jgi:hypothetical protein
MCHINKLFIYLKNSKIAKYFIKYSVDGIEKGIGKARLAQKKSEH